MEIRFGKRLLKSKRHLAKLREELESKRLKTTDYEMARELTKDKLVQKYKQFSKVTSLD